MRDLMAYPEFVSPKKAGTEYTFTKKEIEAKFSEFDMSEFMGKDGTSL